MGLTATAKGLTAETEYNCGYISFHVFRIELAKTYNAEFGALHEKWCNSGMFGEKLTEQELERLNELCNDDLDVFLTHSDCDGRFTPKECRLIYNAIKDLQMDMVGHNYVVMKDYNMLEHWKAIFKHCATRRVTLFFQ